MKRFATVALACSLAFPLYAKDLATVNGKAITSDQVDQFISLMVEQGAKDSPELREQVKKEMINRQVVVQAAEKAGLEKDPAVKMETELARQSILVRALMAKFIEDNPISEAEVKKEYDELKAEQAARNEFNVRHILVKTEDEAKKLIEEIKDEKISFADAAKKESIDTGSGHNGGELGWAPTTNYVPEFAQAVESMKKGELSEKPVKSQFGWHIIEVEDIRPIPFPTFEESKAQLEEMMRQQALADYQETLIKDAKIVDNK